MMMELEGIEKYYRSGLGKTYVVRNVDLSIDDGEFVSIMGPSGAGKSTLLNILGVLDSPSSGSYLFDGVETAKMNEGQLGELHKANMGFIFQAYHLIDELTVYENIETPLLYRGVTGKDRKGMVSDILDRFNIVGKRDLFPSQLSGGQQQVVGVARAVISEPRIILADEPTGNLSTREGESIMAMFKELNDGGTTIIQATHSEANAAWADRTIEIVDGWLTKEAV